MLARSRVTVAAVAVTLTALTATACAPADQGTGSGSTQTTSASALVPGQGDCTPDQLKTLKTDTFTFGTDQPVYAPWYVNNNPTNGQGFESAVAYAIASRLGYTYGQVVWVRVTFNAAIQPGPKTFDADLDEFSITPQRESAVDFSAPYYDVTQAVITTKGSAAAGVTTLAGLRNLKIGAQVGTTSYTAAQNVIKPNTQVSVYNSNQDAEAALSDGQIDALVVDLPTAFEITSAGEVHNSEIVGQLPQNGQAEQFGAVLDKGSPLTACVSAAVQSLRSDGTLTNLANQWLAQAGSAPVLK